MLTSTLLLSAAYVTADDLLPVALARKHLRHLFRNIPGHAGHHRRRRRLADTQEWLTAIFASQSPG
jgi:hypothetical protein